MSCTYTGQYSLAMLFIMLPKVVLTFESAYEILNLCDMIQMKAVGQYFAAKLFIHFVYALQGKWI